MRKYIVQCQKIRIIKTSKCQINQEKKIILQKPKIANDFSNWGLARSCRYEYGSEQWTSAGTYIQTKLLYYRVSHMDGVDFEALLRRCFLHFKNFEGAILCKTSVHLWFWRKIWNFFFGFGWKSMWLHWILKNPKKFFKSPKVFGDF